MPLLENSERLEDEGRGVVTGDVDDDVIVLGGLSEPFWTVAGAVGADRHDTGAAADFDSVDFFRSLVQVISSGDELCLDDVLDSTDKTFFLIGWTYFFISSVSPPSLPNVRNLRDSWSERS